jgi:hypothetical protein
VLRMHLETTSTSVRVQICGLLSILPRTTKCDEHKRSKRITDTVGKPVEESDGIQVGTQDPGLHLPGSKLDLSDWTA